MEGRLKSKITLLAGLLLAPVAMWITGSAIARIVPQVYRAEVLVAAPERPGRPALLDSPELIDAAAAALAPVEGRRPMSRQVLRSNLSHRPLGEQGLYQITARGRNPSEASRTLATVIEACESLDPTDEGIALVYAAPVASDPMVVPHGTRIALGCAGFATLGLLMSIPLLCRLERLSGIARASGGAGFPRAGECLPAAQPAG